MNSVIFYDYLSCDILTIWSLLLIVSRVAKETRTTNVITENNVFIKMVKNYFPYSGSQQYVLTYWRWHNNYLYVRVNLSGVWLYRSLCRRIDTKIKYDRFMIHDSYTEENSLFNECNLLIDIFFQILTYKQKCFCSIK